MCKSFFFFLLYLCLCGRLLHVYMCVYFFYIITHVAVLLFQNFFFFSDSKISFKALVIFQPKESSVFLSSLKSFFLTILVGFRPRYTMHRNYAKKEKEKIGKCNKLHTFTKKYKWGGNSKSTIGVF